MLCLVAIFFVVRVTSDQGQKAAILKRAAEQFGFSDNQPQNLGTNYAHSEAKAESCGKRESVEEKISSGE